MNPETINALAQLIGVIVSLFCLAAQNSPEQRTHLNTPIAEPRRET